MYIHTHTYAHTHTHTHTHILHNIYIYMYMYRYTHTHTHTQHLDCLPRQPLIKRERKMVYSNIAYGGTLVVYLDYDVPGLKELALSCILCFRF